MESRRLKIKKIADREERILRKLLNCAPSPHLTEVTDYCSACNQPTHRSDICIVEDREGLFEDGVKVCKRCREKQGLTELFNECALWYHGLTEAILRVRDEANLKNLIR